MKPKLSLLLAAFLLLAAPLMAQDGSKGTITSAGTTSHDLSTATGTLCGVCHIPHQNAADNRTLLWNHATTQSTAYTAYSSATLNATVTALDQSAPAQQTGDEFYSLACMSCHDGVTATNVVYRVPDGLTGTAAGSNWTIGSATTITALNTIGTALANDHPVNFTYDTALATADGGLYDPASGTSFGNWSTVRTSSKGSSGQEQMPVLFNGTMQCATCHNPHNNTNGLYLREANTDSALCLRCHSTT